MQTSRRLGKHSLKDSRGIALITTLLLLLLVTAMTLAMVLAVNSDMLMNGYYRNFRGSFYAADSGLNIVRQDFYQQLKGQVPATISVGTQPISTAAQTAVLSYINSKYSGGYNSITTTGQAASSWPGKYKINAVTADPTATSDYFRLTDCEPTPAGGTCASPTDPSKVTAYTYSYEYWITGTGQATGVGQATLVDRGTLKVVAQVAPAAGVSTSFAAWGMFIDQYNICGGGSLVPGTISGPVFTNGSWTFGDSGSYIFTDAVGQAGSKFGYQYSSGNNPPCNQSSATSDKYKHGGVTTTIAPTFQVNPPLLGQPAVPLPQDDYNQKRAVLDGKGDNDTNPSKSEMNAALKNRAGTAYPTSGNATGVYMPYTVDGSGNKTMTGGGIYVEGNAQVVLSTSGSTQQVYTITQGSSPATVTTITVDTGSNITTIVDKVGNNPASPAQTITGVPMQYDPNTGAPVRDATMLYVNGNITGLSGPATGPDQHLPAIQDGTALTIAASSNVTVTGDIEYKNKPVTTTQGQIPGTPADTLIPSNDSGQVLGIYTSNGNIQLASKYGNNKNLEIDASIATLGQNCSTCSLVNTGNSINTLTIIGGRIQNTISNIGSSTRNVLFDRRFSAGGFSPPWFPSTTITQPGVNQPTLTPTFSRVQWQNRTSYY